MDISADGIFRFRKTTGSARASAFTDKTFCQSILVANKQLQNQLNSLLGKDKFYSAGMLHELIQRMPFTSRARGERFLNSTWSSATCHYAESFGRAVRAYLDCGGAFNFQVRLETAREAHRALKQM